jgi:hypothetical protein
MYTLWARCVSPFWLNSRELGLLSRYHVFRKRNMGAEPWRCKSLSVFIYSGRWELKSTKDEVIWWSARSRVPTAWPKPSPEPAAQALGLFCASLPRGGWFWTLPACTPKATQPQAFLRGRLSAGWGWEASSVYVLILPGCWFQRNPGQTRTVSTRFQENRPRSLGKTQVLCQSRLSACRHSGLSTPHSSSCFAPRTGKVNRSLSRECFETCLRPCPQELLVEAILGFWEDKSSAQRTLTFCFSHKRSHLRVI